MLYTLPVIWLVVSIVFLLIHLVPGDPIQQMLGEGAPPADIAATRHAFGLDAPLGEQYLRVATMGQADAERTLLAFNGIGASLETVAPFAERFMRTVARLREIGSPQQAR